MRRILVVAGLAILIAATAAAQYGGFVGTSRSGFGNVVFPGTGGPPVPGLGLFPPPQNRPIGGAFVHQNFGARLGATVSGFPPYTGGAVNAGYGYPVGGALQRRSRVVAVPYAYPVYVGGYQYPYQQEPNVTIVYQQPPPGYAYQPPPAYGQQPQAPVVINQNFAEPARPLVQEYRAPSRYDQPQSSAGGANDPPYYLIALKDNTIYSAVGYWLDGDTLHYILSNNVHNQVSLGLVDRKLTEELNKDRSNPVRLGR